MDVVRHKHKRGNINQPFPFIFHNHRPSNIPSNSVKTPAKFSGVFPLWFRCILKFGKIFEIAQDEENRGADQGGAGDGEEPRPDYLQGHVPAQREIIPEARPKEVTDFNFGTIKKNYFNRKSV